MKNLLANKYNMPATKQPLQTILDNIQNKIISATNDIASETEARQAADKELEATIDMNVETSTEISSDEDSVLVMKTNTNILTKDETYVAKVIPTVSMNTAGVMDKALFKRFLEMGQTIELLTSSLNAQPRIAAVSGLPDDPSQTELTEAFNTNFNSPSVTADRIIDISHQREYIFDGNEWIKLGIISINLAGVNNDGLVTHSEIEGAVSYWVPGVGQVNGWSELKAAVLALQNYFRNGGGDRWQQFVQSGMDTDILTALGA